MIFLDSGFLYSYINKEDSSHMKVKSIMEEILNGKFGSIYISSFIYDEVLTLARFRTRHCDVGDRIKILVNKKVKGNKLIRMVTINENLLVQTDELFEKYCKEGLSFTDCSILAIMNEKKIEYLATLAEEFKGKKTLVGID